MAKDRLVHKINVPENRTEYVPESWTLQWNLVNGQYEYAPPNATSKYNMVQGKFEMRTDDTSKHKMNVPGDRVELGGEDWESTYDLINEEFVMRPKKNP